VCHCEGHATYSQVTTVILSQTQLRQEAFQEETKHYLLTSCLLVNYLLMTENDILLININSRENNTLLSIYIMLTLQPTS
jgi:hypothetical protein